MNILVAEGDHLSGAGIKALLGDTAEIFSVGSVSGLLSELAKRRHDYLVCDSAVEGWDIFRISHLLNSFRYAEYRIPLVVLKETFPFNIHPAVARAYQFELLDSTSLATSLMRMHAAGKHSYPLDSKPLSVLIVEDHVQTAQLLAAFLRKNYTVEIAFDGTSAYDLWQYKRHDVVLLDIGLPDISGTEVLGKILEADPYQAAIMVTGEEAISLPVDMVYAGAWDYFKKPFDFRALEEKIAAVAKLSNIERINGSHLMQTYDALSVLAEIEVSVFEGGHGEMIEKLGCLRRLLEGDNSTDDCLSPASFFHKSAAA